MMNTLSPRNSIDYMQRIWTLRHFWLSLVAMDLRSRYKNSVLGIGWSLLRPLAMTTVLCVVFAGLFNVSMRDYVPFLITGLTIWQFLSECALSGCQSYLQGAHYIRQRPVPLAIFPLRLVLGSGFHALIALILGLAMTAYFRGFTSFPALLYLLPAMLLCLCLGWALAMIVGVIHAHFPDTQHLMEIGLQIVFYLTPVLYPLENFKDHHRLQLLMSCNPLNHMLSIVRIPILDGKAAPISSYVVAVGFTVFFAAVAWTMLRRLESRLVFWI